MGHAATDLGLFSVRRNQSGFQSGIGDFGRMSNIGQGAKILQWHV